MDEKTVRRLIQEELRKHDGRSRFGLQQTQLHAHTGNDGTPQIKAENVIPSVSVTGSVTFAQKTRYTLNLNASFTPRQIQVYGIIAGAYGGNQTRILTIGTAQLTPTFYFQPQTDTSVVTGDIQYPFQDKPAQSSSYLNVTRGGTSNFFAGVSEDHILSVGFPDPTSEADIKARVTVVDFSRTAIILDVPYLEAGWEITLNFVVS